MNTTLGTISPARSTLLLTLLKWILIVCQQDVADVAESLKDLKAQRNISGDQQGFRFLNASNAFSAALNQKGGGLFLQVRNPRSAAASAATLFRRAQSLLEAGAAGHLRAELEPGFSLTAQLSH